MILKKSVTLKLAQLFLRLMQRQQSQKLCRLFISFNQHFCRRCITENTIVWSKKMFSIKVFRINKSLHCRTHNLHTIKSINTNLVGVSRWATRHIPTLFEYFQAVGSQCQFVLLLAIETMICHLQLSALANRIHNHAKILSALGNVLIQHTLVDILCLVHHCVNCHSIEQPFAGKAT